MLIDQVVKYSLNGTDQQPNIVFKNSKSIAFQNVNNVEVCFPYKIELKKGIYKFECWGSKGGGWTGGENNDQHSTPGLGAYVSGNIHLNDSTTTFYIFTCVDSFFNAVEGRNGGGYACSGSPTDIRLTLTENWYDNESLISRIMVAGAGGGAEWEGSIGGNGGGLVGGNSSYHDTDTTFICEGATQNSSNVCYPISDYIPVHGSFGKAGAVPNISFGDSDVIGGTGGGGYYGGTSYPYSFAGSGGSSFISGHPGCNAVENNSETIIHTNQPNHYSGYIFENTTMIDGNETMPLFDDLTSEGIHDGYGAFRITIIYSPYPLTSKYGSYSNNILVFAICLIK